MEMKKLMNFQKELDVRGLKCPLPIVLTRRALGQIGQGQVLRVIASGGIDEFQAFAKQTGHSLRAAPIETGGFEIILSKT